MSTQKIMPGLKPVLEMLSVAPRAIKEIYCRPGMHGFMQIERACQQHGIPFHPASQLELDKICRNSHTAHQGVAARIAEINAITPSTLFSTLPCSPLPLALALDQVQDPGNLGTIARSAWALGCGGLILPEHNSADPGAGAFKASAGALAFLPLCRVTNLARTLDEAEEKGFSIYGAEHAANSESAFSFSWHLPAILVLGSESKGLRPGVAKRCGKMISIPFSRPFDSLNIAQAGAMLIALCARFASLSENC